MAKKSVKNYIIHKIEGLKKMNKKIWVYGVYKKKPKKKIWIELENIINKKSVKQKIKIHFNQCDKFLEKVKQDIEKNDEVQIIENNDIKEISNDSNFYKNDPNNKFKLIF